MIRAAAALDIKWDIRFLELASHVASWSKDPSTKAGAVIVRANNSICSVGFNGFPQEMKDKAEMYEDRDQKYSRIVHAEINAMIFSNETIYGYTLYTWPFSCCDRCVVQMLQAGICRFVYPTPSDDALTRWGVAFDRTKDYIKEAGKVAYEVPVGLINAD